MTTVVLGLDGAAFELLDKWIEAGDLPHLQKICREGVATDMQSCLPPVTCPNWRCYATGVNPGKLGIFWWENVDRAAKSISSTSSAVQFDGREYWTQIDGPVSIVNFPTGYPPSDVHGEFIAGGPGSEQTGYTYPESVESELHSEFNYQVHPKQLGLLEKSTENNACVDEIYQLIDNRFDVLEDRLDGGDYELIHTTVFYINVLQHFYWNKRVVRDAWRRIDDRIGSLLESEDLDNLVIMSDHGSNRIDIEFHINTWLEEQGYLVRTTGTSDLLHRLGFTRETVRPILNRLGVEWWARRILPERVTDLLPDADGRVKKTAKTDAIDWNASSAIASGQGPVYVLKEDETERAAIRDRLIEELDGLQTPSGQQVVSGARPADSVWNGPYLENGPDLVLEQAPNVYIDGSIGAADTFEGPSTWLGENKDIGLFIAHGQDFTQTADLSDMHILDIAPTLLHLHSSKIPDEMDGVPRTELFHPDSESASRDVSFVTTEWVSARTGGRTTPEKGVQSRLNDLGYLSE